DYIRTARAKGLAPFQVYFKHALRNALIPIVTIIALNFGSLIGGAVVTESVFNWPGIGRYLVDSVRYRDYPVIQGVTMITV
ncbi:ABC transporter permease, partial [Klebsiella michiganensis]